MIALRSLLAQLARTEVSEIVLTSGKSPVARVNGGGSEAISRALLSTDVILQLLVGAGGSRHVDGLGPRPLSWATRAEGVGPIVVTAMMLGDDVQATFALRRREGPATLPIAHGDDRITAPPSSRPSPAAPAPIPQSAAAPASAPSPPPAAHRTRNTRPPGRGSVPPERVTLRERRVPPEIKASVEHEPPPRTKPSAPPPPPRDRPRSDRSRRAIVTTEDRRPRSEPAPPSFDLDERRAALPPPPPVAAPRIAPPAIPPTAPLAPFAAPRREQAALTPRTHDAHPRLFSELIRAARESGTSDLHLVAGRRPLQRLAGELVQRGEPIDARVVEEMVLARIPQRLLATLDRDGSCDFALEDPAHGRFRVNVTRQRTGIKAALRLIPRDVPTLATLGLPEAIGAATRHHQGLIVITGPTGHGKTTTLAAIVDILNRETSHHIITVEDPVELVHPRRRAMMSQREVGTHTRSFETALKAALREDPDVIVVGELRDTETVRMALSASETGHLVLGTMSTPSAAKTIDRLIDLFPPGDQQQVRITLAGGLRLIVSQRLVPNDARTGLVAAAEILPGLPALWNLIRDNKTFQIPSLQQRGRGLGIVRLDDSLADLVRAGKILLGDALAVAEAPDELEAAIAGRRSPPAGPPQPPPQPPPSSKLDASLDAGRSLMDRAGAFFRPKGGS